MRSFKLFSLLFVAFILFQSHEFWFQSNKYQLDVHEKCTLDFRVGMGFDGTLWNYDQSRIVSASLYETEKSTNIMDSISEGIGNNLVLSFTSKGTKLLALETNSKYIEIGPVDFNAYLLEDGLYNALASRNEDSLLYTIGKELYARNIKTLINVGQTTDDAHKINTGMPLEIIPLQNPYTLEGSAWMEFKILFQGKPLKEGLVKAWHKKGDKVEMANQFTDANGIVRFKIAPKGEWMISIVTIVPSNDTVADWQSYWGNLTFGYQ